jgi:hypothetical protein
MTQITENIMQSLALISITLFAISIYIPIILNNETKEYNAKTKSTQQRLQNPITHSETTPRTTLYIPPHQREDHEMAQYTHL